MKKKTRNSEFFEVNIRGTLSADIFYYIKDSYVFLKDFVEMMDLCYLESLIKKDKFQKKFLDFLKI